MINAKDCIKGEFYRINHETDPTYTITRFSGSHDGRNRFEDSYCLSNMRGGEDFCFEKSTPYYGERKITLASVSEKYWLELCIRANKLVPRPDSQDISSPLENYQIF